MKIYMVTNRVNGNRYVGQTTKSLKRRKQEHTSTALTKRDNSYFHSAIRKYGIDNFDWEILHDNIDNLDALNRLEIFYIGYYDTFIGDGYNLNIGGGSQVGYKHSAESKLNMSKAQKGKKTSIKTKKKMSEAQKGKKLSAKHKGKIAKAHRGKKFTDDHKRKIAEACSGKNNSMYGRKLSDEEKRRLFEARAKAVIIGDKAFISLIEASEFIGISISGLRKRILHRTKWLDYSYIKGGKSGGN